MRYLNRHKWGVKYFCQEISSNKKQSVQKPCGKAFLRWLRSNKINVVENRWTQGNFPEIQHPMWQAPTNQNKC